MLLSLKQLSLVNYQMTSSAKHLKTIFIGKHENILMS